jgi:predicted metal-dependent peptidase
MVTIVFDISAGCVSNSGFAYLEEKVVAVCASGSVVDDYVRALCDEIMLPDKGAFVQMMVQIRRSDGRMHVEFEYKDRSRWRIDPISIIGMREAFRPKFDD